MHTCLFQWQCNNVPKLACLFFHVYPSEMFYVQFGLILHFNYLSTKIRCGNIILLWWKWFCSMLLSVSESKCSALAVILCDSVILSAVIMKKNHNFVLPFRLIYIVIVLYVSQTYQAVLGCCIHVIVIWNRMRPRAIHVIG